MIQKWLLLLLLVVTISSVNSLADAQSQTFEGGNGWYEFVPGEHLIILPYPPTIHLDVDNPKFSPVQFYLQGSTSEEWNFEFQLPTYLVAENGLDSILCHYDDSSAFSTHSDYYFREILDSAIFWNPRNIQQLKDYRDGEMFIGLGLLANIPPNIQRYQKYSGAFSCRATRVRDGLVLSAEAILIVQLREPKLPGCLGCDPGAFMKNLTRGRQYSLIPGNGRVQPTLTGKEISGIAPFSFYDGAPGESLNICFRLENVAEEYEHHTRVHISYDGMSARWVEGNQFFDPKSGTTVVIDEHGNATIELGFHVELGDSTRVGEYHSLIIITGKYTALQQVPDECVAGAFGIYSHGFLDISVTDQPIPNSFSLLQNFPNPVNGTTQIRYQLPTPTDVELTLYSTVGQKVATLVNEFQYAGEHSVSISTDDFPTGVYFYRLQSPSFASVRKMIIVR